MHLVIIGNGITGISCALTLRRLRPEARISIVSDESAHHYARTALMYVYMGHLRYTDIKPYEDWFWAENRLELVQATAIALQPAAQQVVLGTGVALPYDALLLATGSTSPLHHWPGQHLAGVQSLYNLADLAAMNRDTHGIRRGVVVGGGLIGIELTEMLHSRGIEPLLLVRDAHYWASNLPAAEAALVDYQLRENGVPVRYATGLQELVGDAHGRVCAVRTTTGEEIDCQWVGLATGVRPNLTLAAPTPGLDTDLGILVDEYLRTSLPAVYAAGDCAQHRRPAVGEVPIEQLWYTGRMQGETVAYTLAGQPTPYRRGLWFNSAKFFNLEYQAYGRTPAAPAADLRSFYWQHPTQQVALRIYFETAATAAVVGFTALGLRLRQATCESWIRQRTPLPAVLAQLDAGIFDPEFCSRHHVAIVRAFQQQFPQPALPPPRRRGWFARSNR